jgi:uncharacterized protein (TIGR00730 family)
MRPDPSSPVPAPTAAFRRICVFCGSSPGRNPAYLASAVEMGTALAERRIGLVYGGGSAGLMGALADAALDAGGDVVGVLPTGLFPDGVTASPLRDHHTGTLVIEEVEDMHARKARFHALSDGFVVLPGGLGTLEEMAEIATWAHIGIHDDPIGFLDVDGYFDALLAWFDRAVDDGFLRASARDQLHVSHDPVVLLERMAAHRPVREAKWMSS